MNEFDKTIMMERLTNLDTELTEDELERYCKYSMSKPEDIQGQFDDLDEILQTRILSAKLKYAAQFVEYCLDCFRSGGKSCLYE